MQLIDFLPNRYHERASQRRAHLWRVTVIALFGTVVVGSVMMQAKWRRDLRSQLAQLEPSHAVALEQSARFDQLQGEYSQVEVKAALLVYLEHPWPRTQMLWQITQSLPASVVLSKVRVSQELAEPDGRAVAAVVAEPENPDAIKSLPMTQQDLRQLRKEHDAKQTVVRVSGYTKDPVALQTYVTLLAGNPLFAKAELRSLESQTETRTHGEARFTLLLVVKPGYGQPGGPTGSPQLSAATAAPRRARESERLQ